MITPYLYAIAANIGFGSSSIVFSTYSRNYSPAWVNRLKVVVAATGFGLAVLFFEGWANPSWVSLSFFVLSGWLGLCIGDLFLFRAFADLGPTRTLMLYSLQPFLLGIYGYLFLGQLLSIPQMFAVLCMIGCVMTFLWEQNRKTKSWGLKSIGGAFLGIFFDAIGVMLTRSGFESSPEVGPFQANLLRAAGAIVGFVILSPFAYPRLLEDLKKMDPKKTRIILIASFFGTFVSLSLYLRALKFAHVATLTSIAITAPVWASLIEHVRDRAWPSRSLVVAFGFFLTGFFLLALN